MKKYKRVVLIVILICIAAVAVGYSVYHSNNQKLSTTKTIKTVKQAKTKKKEQSSDQHQSSDKTDQNNQTAVSEQNAQDAQIKNVASDFYAAAYAKDYTKAKSMMTSDFAKQFDALLAGDESQVNASVVRDISTYTDVSTPTSVSNPSVIQSGQTYQVTLKLGKSYEAKVNLKKDGSTYKVYDFSSQDTSLGEGGYAGSSMK